MNAEINSHRLEAGENDAPYLARCDNPSKDKLAGGVMGAYRGWANAMKVQYLGNASFAYSVGIMETKHYQQSH